MHSNEIDLTTANSDVPSNDRHAVSLEKGGGNGFPQPSDIRFSQIWTPGSSSSMLMSLNVMTRTLCRNRAGRYMSQTHASSKSISK